MGATLESIKDQALDLIGEVGGPSVQAFDDDRMRDHIIRAFRMIFKKFHWPQYCEWLRLQIDGTQGFVPSGSFVNVRDYDDFLRVHRDGFNEPLPILPKRINPYAMGTPTQVKYWSHLSVLDANYANYRIRFWPVTSTDYVNIFVRKYPKLDGEEWGWTDVMYLDEDLLVNAGAWLALIGDDLNSNAAEASKALMEARYRDIMAGHSDWGIEVNSGEPYPTQWYEPP